MELSELDPPILICSCLCRHELCSNRQERVCPQLIRNFSSVKFQDSAFDMPFIQVIRQTGRELCSKLSLHVMVLLGASDELCLLHLAEVNRVVIPGTL